MEDEISRMIAGVALLDPSDIRRQASLFSAGIIDSLNMVDILAFVEKRYGIKVKPMDLTLENFDSVDRIAALVRKLKR